MVSFDLEIHGSDLRASCLADFLELQAIRGAPRSEADLADFIRDRNWVRILEDRLRGPGSELPESSNPQDRSRDRASAVLNVIEERQALLGDLYPFEFVDGRRLRQTHDGAAYRWHLYVSMAHGLGLKGVPSPTREFELSVAARLTTAGLPAANFGTAAGTNTFEARIEELAQNFRGLMPTISEALISRSQNDGGIDTFAMFRCGADRRHAQWAFIGQSTVGKSDDWKTKIYEAKPSLWAELFGRRILPLPFFATPHHIAQPYFAKLAQDHEQRCLLDRIRLTHWTEQAPDSLRDYHEALTGLELE